MFGFLGRSPHQRSDSLSTGQPLSLCDSPCTSPHSGWLSRYGRGNWTSSNCILQKASVWLVWLSQPAQKSSCYWNDVRTKEPNRSCVSFATSPSLLCLGCLFRFTFSSSMFFYVTSSLSSAFDTINCGTWNSESNSASSICKILNQISSALF